MPAADSATAVPALLAFCAAALAAAAYFAAATRRLRAALAAGELRLDLIMRATQVGVFDWDVANNRIEYSERAMEILGLRKHADLPDGTRYFDLVHPEDRERARGAFIDHLRRGRDASDDSLHPPIEYRLLSSRAGYRWVRGTGLSVRSADGRTVRYIASIIDITERKRQEIELANQAKFVNDLFDAVPLSLAYRDTDGRFKMINRTWEQYFGISTRERIIGRTLAELRPAEEVAPILAQDRAALERGPDAPPLPQHIEFRGRHYRQTRTAIADAAGRVTGVLITGLDITAEHEMRAALETGQQRLELVVRATRAGIIDWDAASNTSWYSGRLSEMLGHPALAMTVPGPAYFDLIHPEDRERVRGAYADYLRRKDAGGEAVRLAIEYRLRRTDGGYFWVQGTGMALRDPNGRATRYLAAITDVSARREQEEALRTQEHRLDMAVRAGRVGIIDWDAATGATWYSEQFKEMLGYPADTDMSGWDLFAHVHPDEKHDLRKAQLATVKGETGSDTLERESRVRRRDGSYLWVHGMGLTLRGPDGRTTRYIVTVRDTTERRSQEEALRTQEQRLALVVRASKTGIIDWDGATRRGWYSDRLREMLGYAAGADLSAWQFFDAVHPDDKDAMRGQLIATLKGETGSDILEQEYRLQRADGVYLWVRGIGIAVRGADGRASRFLASITDISERRRQEAELRASREEALQAAQAKAAFLAAMSHEIRTPLNGVLGMAGLLADTPLSGEQRDYVETIRVSGDALLSVINDVLDYSKIESGRMELEREPLEPARAVEEAIEILGERARGKRLELIAEVGDAVPEWVLGDLARLRQVLVNLVGNAVKFTERGEVLVRIEPAGEAALRFSVTDTGIGIAPERLDALFQPFTQADVSTTRKYGGTGLGLAISRRLVDLMGGTLAAQSRPGSGSTFSFTVAAPTTARPAGLAVPARPVDLAGRRILIVDDNTTNLRILKHQLERWGAVPVAASAPGAALALIGSGAKLDCALLDYHMPGMDGVMLARRIRARAKKLPLVLLSSSMYRRAEEAEAGLFAAQLLKPVRQQSLREAITSALSGRRPVSAKAKAGKARPAAAAGSRLRVLVVDDVEVNRRVAQLLLRRFGHGAEAAESGQEAIERAAGYDLVLMDLQMPDIDGLEATRRIRERLGAAAPRIVAMTANAMPGDRERCLAAGMDGYLAKPMDAQALEEELRATGRPRPARAAAAAAPEAMLLDRARLATLAQYDDAEHSLTRGVIDAFLRDAPGYVAGVRAAHDRGDARERTRLVHALRGSAGNAGAVALADLAARIEAEAGDGAAAWVESLGETFAKTAAALRKVRE